MKDFFDIWLLARQFDFDGADLARAIAKTFAHRNTELDPDPVAPSAAFMTSETTQRQWTAFVRRSKLENAPATLAEIREPLRQFLVSVATPLVRGGEFGDRWNVGHGVGPKGGHRSDVDLGKVTKARQIERNTP